MNPRGNLTPVPIVDKNGRATTVHRKSSPKSPARNIPSPVAKVSGNQSEFTPSPAQLHKRQHENWTTTSDVNPTIMQITGNSGDTRTTAIFIYEANDVEYYGVRSVTNRPNASALLKHGIRSADKAKEFLTKNGLDHLIEDNSSLTNKALRRKVSAGHFDDLTMRNDISGIDEDRVIDAAAINSIAGYRDLSTHSSPAQRVLNGEIDAADLKKVGVKHMDKKYSVEPIFNALQRIKNGAADYDAAGLRKVLDDNYSRDRDIVGTESLIDLLDVCGVERLLGIKSYATASRTLKKLNGRIASDEVGEFLAYADKSNLTLLGRGINGDRIEGAIALYRAGIDPVEAAAQLHTGVEVEVLIGAHLNVHASVVGGWL